MFLRQLLLPALCLCAVSPLSAQPRHPISWEKSPKLHTVADSLKRDPAVFILEERCIEMQSGDEGYEQYYTTHHIIRLNDNKGVEAFNTFNIPVLPGTKLHEIKARTILPGGRVIEVSRDKIKKIKSEAGMPEYLLAMEAVEPGAEVEVLYTELLPGSGAGREVYQYRVPIQKAIFRLIVPNQMQYDAKGYNGFPNPKDSLMEDQRSYSSVAYGIPALDEETNSRYRASLQRVDYKLSYILRTGNEGERKQSWKEMAKELSRRYINISDREVRTANNLLQKIGVERGDDDVKKIVAIEDYFKSSIAISEGVSDEAGEDFDQTIRKKLSSEKGYVRLFAACLKAAGINYEIGMVGNRYTYELDDSLEMWSNLGEYCFYLPDQDVYLAPAAITYRYPFLPFQMSGTRGVFTRSRMSSDGKASSQLDIRTIPHSRIDQNGFGVNASVQFEGKELTPVVNTTMTMKGHSATGLTQSFLFAPKDKESEAVLALIGLSDKPTDMRSYKVENVTFANYNNGKPLTISATTQAPRLMEKAGPKYLFRAGEMIGKQAEMYADNERKLPVETEYPNEQPRTLRISIPAGYKVVNPEAVRSNVSCMMDGKEVCGFHSDYRMDGSELIVTIREFYARTSYPLNQYQCYRKVVNAAADFNKVVLALQKI